MDNPVSRDLEYADVSEAVRHWTAERLYEMSMQLDPVVRKLYEDDLGFMDPVRISAHTQVGKLHLAVLRELGALYRVAQEPVKPEPVEPMVPARDVPLMIEAAVQAAVTTAVEETKAALEAQQQAQVRIKEHDARAALEAALVRIRGRQ